MCGSSNQRAQSLARRRYSSRLELPVKLREGLYGRTVPSRCELRLELHVNPRTRVFTTRFLPHWGHALLFELRMCFFYLIFLVRLWRPDLFEPWIASSVRGPTGGRPPAANHKPEIESNAKRKASPQQDVLPSTKRLHSQPSNSAQLSVSSPVAPRLYPRVKALGQDYTTLTWYLKKRPNDSQIARAIENCSSRALELSGGDSKTLMLRDFVSKTEAAPPELLPSRRNLSATWAATACMSAKSGELLLARRASDITSCRQILWPCAALEASLRK